MVDQHFDTNLFDFTTNYFQAYDVELTNGLNKITLSVNDLAGNPRPSPFEEGSRKAEGQKTAKKARKPR